ncbi:MAG TPA: hypothetical protein VHX11_10560 [Acidobacteriaceae bacterium]|jgi:hypothetical protein|nr:hypothetical protein [Acidobacteriaceae bacterium]
MLPLLQILAAVVLLAYAGLWRWHQGKRRKRDWNNIVSRLLDHDWGIEEITEAYLYKSEIRATTADIWNRITGCRGLWAMYKNAPVLVDLADYASEHGNGADSEMLEQLRSDAFQIRLYVMMALAQHAISGSSAGASVNAHRAASAYSGMLARLTAYMQEHSGLLFPRYLDAVA